MGLVTIGWLGEDALDSWPERLHRTFEAGIFHTFHTVWIAEIRNVVNGGLLPADFYALAEQHMVGFIAKVADDL